MNIAIFLRKNATKNYFRDLIIELIKNKYGDEVIICSGFFQENFGTINYRVSTEKNLAIELAKNKFAVKTIGIHNNYWKPSYRNFVTALKNANVKITPYIVSGLKWHAKIFILKKKDKPVLSIIGSSNFTRRAFSDDPIHFNYECDVVLWNSRSSKVNRTVTNMLLRIEDRNEVIVSKYDEKSNKMTLNQRLINLEAEMKKLEVKKLDGFD